MPVTNEVNVGLVVHSFMKNCAGFIYREFRVP